jgi:hypothetical protein
MASRETGQGSSLRQSTAKTDAIELKLTIRPDQEAKAIRFFDLDESSGEVRQIYFFDTTKLALFKKGVILRARQIKGGGDDSTVKIRPVDPEKVVPSWKKAKGFKLEADVVGEKVVKSASLSWPQNKDEIEEVARKKRPIDKLFSSDQERFLGSFAPVAVEFKKLKAMGPIEALRWKVKIKGLPDTITAEEWHLPDGSEQLEVSIKVKPGEIRSAHKRFGDFLKKAGLVFQAGQEAKTRVALEYFASSH